MRMRGIVLLVACSAILLGCGREELPLSEECLEFWQVKEGLFPKDDLKCRDGNGATQWLSGSYGDEPNVDIRTCLCTNAAQATECVQHEPRQSTMGGLRWNLATNVIGQLAITLHDGGWRAFARNNVYVSVSARNSDLTLKLCRKIDGYILKCLRQQRKRNQKESPEERYWRRGRELQQMSDLLPCDRSRTGVKWRVPQLFRTSGVRERGRNRHDVVISVRPGKEQSWLDFFLGGERIARCRVREWANRGEARDWMFAEAAKDDAPLPVLARRMDTDNGGQDGQYGILYPKGFPRKGQPDVVFCNFQNAVVELHVESSTNATVTCACWLAGQFWARCEAIADKPEDGIEMSLADMTCKICPPYRISEICRHVPELRLSRVFGINDELIGRIVGSAKKGSWVEFAFKLDKPYGPFDEAKVELGGWTMQDRTLNLHRLKLVHQFDDEMSTAELQEAYRKVVQMVGESLGCDLPVPEFDPETPSKDRFYVDPATSLTLMPWSCTNRIFVNGRTPEYVQRNGKWILLGKPTVSVEFQFGRPYPPDPGPDGKPIVPKAISFGSDESRAFSAALRDKDYMYED